MIVYWGVVRGGGKNGEFKVKGLLIKWEDKIVRKLLGRVIKVGRNVKV